MIITKGDTAAIILDNYLKDLVDSRICITGSSFENDYVKKEYNFQILSYIIQSMEQGNKLTM